MHHRRGGEFGLINKLLTIKLLGEIMNPLDLSESLLILCQFGEDLRLGFESPGLPHELISQSGYLYLWVIHRISSYKLSNE